MLGIMKSLIAVALQSGERVTQFTEYKMRKARLIKSEKTGQLEEESQVCQKKKVQLVERG